MSIYGHYYQQYFGSKPKEFPKESFKISGISFYQSKLQNINYDSELFMELEPDNNYDTDAIKILFNSETIGYVPKDSYIKNICKNNIDSILKIIIISPIENHNKEKIIGIRVIPENCIETGI